MGTENNELLDGQQSDDEGIFGEALADGMGFLTRFWEEKYLKEYIRDGGSKIKFITGRPGSGKTYFLQQMTNLAQQENYKTVWFSAKDIWMHDFQFSCHIPCPKVDISKFSTFSSFSLHISHPKVKYGEEN